VPQDRRCRVDDIWKNFLAKQNWIDRLPDASRQALQGVLQPRTFARGALIYNRTERAGGLYIIRDGSALFQIHGFNGKQLLLKIIRANEVFGETIAYDGKPSPIAVEARSALLTSFVPADQLSRLRHQYPEIERALADIAVQNLRAALSAIEELNLLDLRQRTHACLARLCADYPETGKTAIHLDITQAELASMLGASRQATNAMLGEFEEAGWLVRNFRSLCCLPGMPGSPGQEAAANSTT
jgi:CRP/FNR family transcriptional regulator, cyclic AMP receptor protein